jgi:hypothetical protein
VGEGSYGNHVFSDSESGTTMITVLTCDADARGSGLHGDGTCNAATGYDPTEHDEPAVFGQLQFGDDYYKIGGLSRDETDPPWSWGISSAYHFKISFSGVGQYAIREESSGSAPSNLEFQYIWTNATNTTSASRQWHYRTVHSGSGWHIHHSYMNNGNVMIRGGDGADDHIIEYNFLDTTYNWESNHSEMIQTLGNDGWTLRYNVFKDMDKQGTGTIMLNNANNFKIYGNVFYDHRTEAGGYSDGLIATTGGKGYTAINTKIYNNTIINTDCRIDSYNEFTGTSEVKNNLYYDCDTSLSFGSGITHTYNACGGSNCSLSEGGTEQTGLLSTIFTDYGGDDFTLTAATDDGTDLSSPYNTDMLGNTRGNDGTWDRGASEYGTPPPQTATGLSIQ